MPCCLWKLAIACKFGTPKASVINYPQCNIPNTFAKIKLRLPKRTDETLFSVVPASTWTFSHPSPTSKPWRETITFEKHLRQRGKNCTWNCFPDAEPLLSNKGTLSTLSVLCPTAYLLTANIPAQSFIHP